MTFVPNQILKAQDLNTALSARAPLDPSTGQLLPSTFPASGVEQGDYGSAVTVPAFAVDKTGRVTSADSVPLQGIAKIYSTKASAVADLPNLSNGNSIEIIADESIVGSPRTHYQIASGALVLLTNFDAPIFGDSASKQATQQLLFYDDFSNTVDGSALAGRVARTGQTWVNNGQAVGIFEGGKLQVSSTDPNATSSSYYAIPLGQTPSWLRIAADFDLTGGHDSSGLGGGAMICANNQDVNAGDVAFLHYAFSYDRPTLSVSDNYPTVPLQAVFAQTFSSFVMATVTSGSTAVIAVGGTFSNQSNVNVSGTGIPTGTTLAYVDSTHATLSQAATASGTALLTIDAPLDTSGATQYHIEMTFDTATDTVTVLNANGQYVSFIVPDLAQYLGPYLVWESSRSGSTAAPFIRYSRVAAWTRNDSDQSGTERRIAESVGADLIARPMSGYDMMMGAIPTLLGLLPGMAFGPNRDVTLYRGGPNVLKTDGAITASGLALNIQTYSADATLSSSASLVLVNGTGTAYTLPLADSVPVSGWLLIFKNDTLSAVTLSPSTGDKIDGSSSGISVASLGAVILFSNHQTSWFRIL